MPELEIVDNQFDALTAADPIPTHVAFEDCDLNRHAPPKPLPGLQVLETADCELDQAGLAAWLAACPDLEHLSLHGALLGDLTWDQLPPRLHSLHIHGGELHSLLGARATGGLKSISLSACKLHKVELPKSLSNLESISLAWNDQLEACPDLPWSAAPFRLDLRGCALDTWPDVEGADKIAKLDLSDNPITAIPPTISKCYSLDSLRMQQCKVSRIAAEIRELKFLKDVRLADNPLRDLPDAFGQLPSLTVLDLVRCELQGWPEALHSASQLESLGLSENQIAEVPETVSELANLRSLQLWKTGLQRLPSTLRQLRELRQLDVSYNPLERLPDLSGMPALGYLGLCGLRDLDWSEAFEQLANLQHIGQISFTNSTFERFDHRVLAIPGLTRIDVNKTPVTEDAWQALRHAHPDVTIWT